MISSILPYFRFQDRNTDSVRQFLSRPRGAESPCLKLHDEILAENELKSEAYSLLNELAKLGRAAGIHLVLATQFLDLNVVGGELLQNCTTRIAAGRLSEEQSHALLNNDEATRINGVIRGRGYLQNYGTGADFQGYYAPQDYLDDPTN